MARPYTRGVDIQASAERSAAGVLLALAALHAAWATGSTWPAQDVESLGDLVAGRTDGSLPGRTECLAVAGLLTTAATVVAGRPRRLPALQRTGAGGVAAVLGVRAAFGLAGRTDVLVPGSVSPRFKRLDRRYFSPLCLALALAAASSASTD
jgi:hypothetical protein